MTKVLKTLLIASVIILAVLQGLYKLYDISYASGQDDQLVLQEKALIDQEEKLNETWKDRVSVVARNVRVETIIEERIEYIIKDAIETSDDDIVDCGVGILGRLLDDSAKAANGLPDDARGDSGVLLEGSAEASDS